MAARTARIAVGAGLLAAIAWGAQGFPARYGGLAGATVREVASPVAAYRLSAVALTASSGRRLTCTLRTPARPAAPHSLVGVALQGGIGTGRRAVTLVGEEFPGLVLSCDYPWRDPSDLPLWRFLATLPAIRRDVLGTPGALRVAATYLLSRPEVDPARLAAVGASLGVPGVSAWVRDDPRVAVAALLMGGADLPLLLEANLRSRIRWAPLRRGAASLLGWLLRPLEPARTVGGIAPRPLLIVAAADDDRIPRAATLALYRSAGEPKELLWLAGRHLVPRDTTLLREITDSTFAWVSRHLAGRP